MMTLQKINRNLSLLSVLFLVAFFVILILPTTLSAQTNPKVRFIYLVPSDKSIRDDYKAALTDAALQIQDFYQKELNGRTFTLNAPIVEVYQTSHAASWYSTNPVGSDRTYWFYYNLLNDGYLFTGANFDDPNNRWIYFIDADGACDQVSVAGTSGIAIHSAPVLRGLTKQAGLDPCPDGLPEIGRHYRTIGGIAHEMGHAFRLDHPAGCNDAYCQGSLMSNGFRNYPNTYFLSQEKTMLLTSPPPQTPPIPDVSQFFTQIDLRPPQYFDFDGDRKADVSVWRPTSGFWHILQSTNEQSRSVNWGTNGDKIVPGDYDGDRKTDTAVWRPSNATWYILRSSDNTYTVTQFGQTTDTPVAADFDGDLKTDIAVWRPSNGGWYVLRSATNILQTIHFGSQGDYPLIGDFNGDKRSDFAVWRPSNRNWYILNYYMSSAATLIMSANQFGLTGDKLVPGDYDGDKKTDIAVWRPSDGTWYISQSQNGFTATQFGANGDTPVPADYDGDGKTDVGVWRPGNGFWYLQQSTNGYRAVYYGINGDIPVPTYFIR